MQFVLVGVRLARLAALGSRTVLYRLICVVRLWSKLESQTCKSFLSEYGSLASLRSARGHLLVFELMVSGLLSEYSSCASRRPARGHVLVFELVVSGLYGCDEVLLVLLASTYMCGAPVLQA